MIIIFSNHSLLKLQQRIISQKLVTETLKNSDHISKSYSDREISYKKFGRLYLKVIFRREEKHIIVITQHWVKQIQ